jgi:hypothetical protein
MALHAVAVRSPVAASPRTPVLASHSATATASLAGLRPSPRPVAVAAARRERRKWMAVGVVVFATPFLASLGVLEVLH